MPHSSQTGFFITFEGSEGCGKSTQIRRLASALESAGHPPLLVREPGGTAIGERIRNILQHSKEGLAMVPEAELLLFAASRAQLVREIILPALAEGRTVISDRFLDSTTVYQGVARKLGASDVEAINLFAAGPRKPSITFLMDMDSATAMIRTKSRGGEKFDRMEQLPAAFYEAVRSGYLEAAAREPERFRVIDASLDEETISEKILNELRRHGHFQGIRI